MKGKTRKLVHSGQAAKLAGAYALFSAVWVVFSDQVVESLFPSLEDLALAQTGKGLIFVLLSTFLVYSLVRWYQNDVRNLVEEFDRLFQQTPDPMVFTDAEQRILLVNASFVEAFGHPADEIKGRPFASLFYGGQAPVYDGRLKGPDKYEALFLKMDGGIFCGEAVCTDIRPSRDQEGMVCQIRDISERKKVEKSLGLANALLEQASIAIFEITEPDGQIKTVNDQACRYLGYRREELLAMTVFELDPNLTRPKDWLESRRMLREKGSLRFETSHRGRDGSLIPVEVLVNHIEFDGESRSVSFVLDNSSRKKAEAERERALKAMEQVSDAISIFDPDGVIEYANPAFFQTCGYAEEEVLGRNIFDLKGASGAHPPEFFKDLWETIRQGEPWHGRLLSARKDGRPLTEETTISPVRNEHGEIAYYVAVEWDVTTEASLEAKMREAQRLEAIGRLAGGVAHDFNNMLSVILGCAELGMSGAASQDRNYSYFNEIKKASVRSADLTKHLLAFARQQSIRPQVVDLNRAVGGMISMLRRMIGTNVQMAWLPGADLCPVLIDPAQIDQILANLVVNARDAIGDVGRITIESANMQLDKRDCRSYPGCKPGGYVVITVADDGCGIDPQHVERIFEPFYTTKSADQGTGLGLATVYGVVKQNGGFVDVSSEVGQGTEFRIYLPRYDGAEIDEEDLRPKQSPPRGNGETILVVDDEQAVLEMTSKTLQGLGYKVLAASSAEKGLQAAEEHDGEIALLLTDVVMPKMNGKMLAEKIALERPGIKVLYSSGYTANVLDNPGMVKGKQEQFIGKPFTIYALAKAVKETIYGGN